VLTVYFSKNINFSFLGVGTLWSEWWTYHGISGKRLQFTTIKERVPFIVK
jgi:hypothetical protein